MDNFNYDYKQKYIKYKLKYLNILNQNGGGNNTIKPLVETKCISQSHKVLCPNNTINLGLCVENIKDCDKPEIIGLLPNIKILDDDYKEEYEKKLRLD